MPPSVGVAGWVAGKERMGDALLSEKVTLIFT